MARAPLKREIGTISMASIVANSVPIGKQRKSSNAYCSFPDSRATEVAWRRRSTLPSSSTTIRISPLRRGLRCAVCSSASRRSSAPAELLAQLKNESPDAILLDLNFQRGATDGREGLDFLGRIMAQDADAAVVIITAHGAVSVAVEAIKAGASDFVAKPWSNERLAATVRSAAALRRSRMDARTERGRASELAPSAETPLMGSSPAMERVRTLVARAAPTDANVLILGENGTGKEIVAREIHRQSRRCGHPMISIDLGATAETLFDSELFGHVKGAFTGADGERIGRLKAADRSTLFLDEIGNLPLHLQPKLLTALEQREVVPVGANRPVPIDVRVVAATNVSVEQLADAQRFRQDLLFRLNTIEIELPPLRERREDIALLLDHYLGPLRAQVRQAAARASAGRARAVDAPRLAGQRPRAAPCRRARGDHGRWRPLSDRGFPLPQRSEAAALSVGRRHPQPRPARAADDRARAAHAPFQRVARRLGARAEPRRALSAHGEAWTLGASSSSALPGARSFSSAPSRWSGWRYRRPASAPAWSLRYWLPPPRWRSLWNFIRRTNFLVARFIEIGALRGLFAALLGPQRRRLRRARAGAR